MQPTFLLTTEKFAAFNSIPMNEMNKVVRFCRKSESHSHWQLIGRHTTPFSKQDKHTKWENWKNDNKIQTVHRRKSRSRCQNRHEMLLSCALFSTSIEPWKCVHFISLHAFCLSIPFSHSPPSIPSLFP